MDYYVHIVAGDCYVVDTYYNREENTRVLKDLFCSGILPEEIRFIVRTPEEEYLLEPPMAPKPDKLTVPFKILLRDFMADGSSINRFFGVKPGDLERKAELFNRIWGVILYKTLNRESYFLPSADDGIVYAAFFGEYGIDEESCVFGETSNCHYFKVGIPRRIMLKYYPRPKSYNPYLRNIQQYFDLKLLDEDDMISYVIPLYYMDFAYWKESSISNAGLMGELTACWIQTLYGACD